MAWSDGPHDQQQVRLRRFTSVSIALHDPNQPRQRLGELLGGGEGARLLASGDAAMRPQGIVNSTR